MGQSPDEDLLRARREAAGIAQHQPAYGLALSGGGIRSATFNFGLLRGLAKNRVLRRFDYLSTVSGGGYIGAMFGRLFGHKDSALEVEQGLAKDDSQLLWWLRNNGRYLTPAGSRDRMQAFASMLRGFVATQWEVAVLMLLVAVVVVLPHTLFNLWLPDPLSQLADLPSAWFWLALVPLFACVVLSWAYWFSRDLPTPGSQWLDGLGALLALAGALVLFGMNGQNEPYSLVIALLLAIPLGWAVQCFTKGPQPAQRRLRLTDGLARAVAYTLLTFALGVADLLAWRAVIGLYQRLHSDDALLTSTGLFGSSGVLVLVVRGLLPPVMERLKAKDRPSVAMDKVANLLGIGLLLALQMFWIIGLQAFVYLCPGDASPLAHWLSPLGHALTVFVALSLYALVGGANLQQLNLASMHYYYRSRLARTYVSVGNQSGLAARFKTSPLSQTSINAAGQELSVRELLDEDDIAIADYQPHVSGGPVHLINCCINQTVDDRTGSYNADRKGVALTISQLGIETGTEPPQPAKHAPYGQTTLAQWVDISGAAVGSGMGSMTSIGLAALVFLSGMRLGFWVDNLTKSQARRHWLAKYWATLAELLAKFPGLGERFWYLSDGGHFDNTGVYALLKRRLPVIVAADCGVDPQYLFRDIENLVLKARIDYSAQIEFIDPGSIRGQLGYNDTRWKMFGTPESISPLVGDAFLMLARITYADDTIGSLLVVKPRVSSAMRLKMPFDLIGYADRNTEFPQQNTIDQFFDESQWESYHGLGLTLASVVDSGLLDALPTWVREGRPVAMLMAVVNPQEQETRKQRVAQTVSTVKTSLGIGLSATLLLGVLQALDQHRDSVTDGRKQYEDMYKDVAASLGNFENPKDFKQKLDKLDDIAAEQGMAESLKRDRNALVDTINSQCSADFYKCQAYLLVANPRKQQSPMQRYWSDTARFAGLVASDDAPQPGLQATVVKTTPAEGAPANVAPAGAVAVPVLSECKGGNSAVVLYTQVYSEAGRARIRPFLSGLRQMGLSTPGIENVANSAQNEGSVAPKAGPRAYFMYHADPERPCATYLAGLYSAVYSQPADVLKLPATQTAVAGVIELWVPNNR